MGFIPIKTYLSASLAHVDKGALEEQGIQCVVENENIVGTNGLMQGAYGNIQLSVWEPDVAKAKTLLSEMKFVPLEDSEDEDDVYRCPNCKSTNFSEYAPYMWTIICPIFFPLLFIRSKVCHDCDHKWK